MFSNKSESTGLCHRPLQALNSQRILGPQIDDSLSRPHGQRTDKHPFDQHVLDLALTLIERQGVGGRDAVHAATALLHGIPEIVSPDSDFDGIEGLMRLDPRELA